MKNLVRFFSMILLLIAPYSFAEGMYFVETGGVFHSDVQAAEPHKNAAKNCAAASAHLCRISEWTVISDVQNVLNPDEMVWIDGIDPVSSNCEGYGYTSGLRMKSYTVDGGGQLTNVYMQYGPVACAQRGTQLRYRCCM